MPRRAPGQLRARAGLRGARACRGLAARARLRGAAVRGAGGRAGHRAARVRHAVLPAGGGGGPARAPALQRPRRPGGGRRRRRQQRRRRRPAPLPPPRVGGGAVPARSLAERGGAARSPRCAATCAAVVDAPRRRRRCRCRCRCRCGRRWSQAGPGAWAETRDCAVEHATSALAFPADEAECQRQRTLAQQAYRDILAKQQPAPHPADGPGAAAHAVDFLPSGRLVRRARRPPRRACRALRTGRAEDACMRSRAASCRAACRALWESSLWSLLPVLVSLAMRLCTRWRWRRQQQRSLRHRRSGGDSGRPQPTPIAFPAMAAGVTNATLQPEAVQRLREAGKPLGMARMHSVEFMRSRSSQSALGGRTAEESGDYLLRMCHSIDDVNKYDIGLPRGTPVFDHSNNSSSDNLLRASSRGGSFGRRGSRRSRSSADQDSVGYDGEGAEADENEDVEDEEGEEDHTSSGSQLSFERQRQRQRSVYLSARDSARQRLQCPIAGCPHHFRFGLEVRRRAPFRLPPLDGQHASSSDARRRRRWLWQGLKQRAKRHFCGECQRWVCWQHTKICPHGKYSHCSIDSKCVCVRCYDALPLWRKFELDATSVRLRRQSAGGAGAAADSAGGGVGRYTYSHRGGAASPGSEPPSQRRRPQQRGATATATAAPGAAPSLEELR
eukprot:scaffold964_cov229-Prasinococcus_capsulatus_cf.AAC.1